jgi:hypothetical protein
MSQPYYKVTLYSTNADGERGEDSTIFNSLSLGHAIANDHYIHDESVTGFTIWKNEEDNWTLICQE